MLNVDSWQDLTNRGFGADWRERMNHAEWLSSSWVAGYELTH